MCSLPGVCAGWVAPRALLFRVGVEKRGENLLFGSLPVFLLFVWSGRRDLNPLPPPWEGGALPGELRPQACAPPVRLFVRGLVLGVERMTGLEPATFTLAR